MVSQNKLYTVIHFHHLSYCDLYTPPTAGREGETEACGDENDQQGQNEELVPNRGTISVAWSRVFKHCSFKTTDFKPLKQTTRVPVWLSVQYSFCLSFMLIIADC